MKQAIPQTSVKHSSREAGFTLVEALTSIVILVFGLVAVTNLLIVAGSSSQVANAGTAAAAIAGEQMEALKNLSFMDPLLVPGGDLDNDAPNYFRRYPTDPRLRIQGAGTINVRWRIVGVTARLLHITVRAEAEGVLLRGRTRAEYTSFRACTDPLVNAGVCAAADLPCCP